MKKMLLVALMLSVAGTAAYASLINAPVTAPAAPAKRVECTVNGKVKLVKTADACKALGGTVVEANREFMPAGQGVGAIHELIPAGDIVRSMIAEAERVIERLAATRG